MFMGRGSTVLHGEEALATLLNTVAPIFGIIFLGFLAVRARVLDEAGVKGLVTFVFNFAIPLLLFRSLATIELPEDIQWSFVLSFYGGSYACFYVGMLLGRFPFNRTLKERALFGMAGGFTNTVLLGIPIIITAYGPEAMFPILLLLAFHSATLLPLTTIIIEVAQGEHISAMKQAKGIGIQVLKNPIIMGLLLGLCANLVGLVLPSAIDTTVELMASSAIPCALFAMGASLAGYPLMGDVAPAVSLSAVKLVLHPILVWILAVPVFGLEGIWVPVAVTMAAMPTGVVAYLFSARHHAAQGVVARTVVLTTLASVGTISFVLLLFS
jgi:predicted permease